MGDNVRQDTTHHRAVDLARCKAVGEGSAQIGDMRRPIPHTNVSPPPLNSNDFFSPAIGEKEFV